jgi:hypothetical protein
MQLDPDQVALARHVWRRGRLRRQLMFVTLGVVGAVLLLGGLRLRSHPVGVQQPVVRPASLQGPAVYRSPVVAGLQLSVTRAEMSPTGVTLWWTVTGKGARQWAVRLPNSPGTATITPDLQLVIHHELIGVTAQQVDGRSIVPGGGRVVVGPEVSLRMDPWDPFTLLANRQADPNARKILVNQSVQGKGLILNVKSITVAESYTLINFTGFAFHGPASVVTILVNGKPLNFGGHYFSVFNEQEDIFGPIPDGVTDVQVQVGLVGAGVDDHAVGRLPWRDSPAIRNVIISPGTVGYDVIFDLGWAGGDIRELSLIDHQEKSYPAVQIRAITGVAWMRSYRVVGVADPTTLAWLDLGVVPDQPNTLLTVHVAP